jgi:gluconolactonase
MALHALSRRALISGTAGIAGAAALSRSGLGQTPGPAPAAQTGTPPSTITNPPRDWSPGHPSIYPDPDVIVVDPSFRTVAPGNAAVQRLWTGAQWAEGPAWSSQGQYLVFSDVTGNTQYRTAVEHG